MSGSVQKFNKALDELNDGAREVGLKVTSIKLSDENAVKNFEDVFLDALDQLEVDAKSVGLTLTSICRDTGVSRATPDRWRKKVPNTVQILSEMQKVVDTRREKLEAETKDALHHD